MSVLLPVRNAESTLDECLLSIRRQSLDDFELLVVDDACTDGSIDILRAHAASDHRIRILGNPRPGLVAALNLGLQAARAPLVARMDADDRMYPQRLQRQWQWLQARPELTVAGSQVRIFPEAELRAGLREYLRWQNACLSSEQIATDIYREAPLAHPSVMYRRRRILAIGGYRAGDFAEDYDLWLRLVQAGDRLGKVPEVLLDWRDGPQRLSRRDPRCRREAFDRLRARYLASDPRLKQRPLAIWGAGRKTRRRCRHLLEQGFRPQVWIDIDPRKIGNRVGGIPVCPPDWLANAQPRPLVLVYVANHGAREQIAAQLQDLGYRPGEDFLQIG
ncbi:glycosyltransferase [Thiohalobacter sp. IOR34]|uniref:glycosyltransferase family 2 protein n=1 Tax=Thiohalobacter sp. IOR34 TaxID=3057176 RepID=UPI0025AF83FC|nr:glycosyltransferase [Thiohalobacter sp. IOR34]WJW75999.1 glycosyltransferase [Thiohalobacter sp. IOR34]